jgi:hypothetical protein
MGLTTESAHLFLTADPPASLDATAHAIRQHLSATGFEESTSAEDRVFVLVASPHWISIYDTETGALDALVKSLSKALAAHVAALCLEDSDKYTARLCSAGAWVDKISGGVLKRKATGKPDLWRPVLAPDSEADVARALEGRGTFAEEPLGHLCRALRLPPSAALQVAEEIKATPPPGALVLRFRSLHPKVPQGPPRLTLVNRGHAPETVGQPVSQLFIAVANDGPTAKGVRISLAGEALAQSLITPVELHVVTIVPFGGGIRGDRQTHSLRRLEQGYSVDLPHLELLARIDPRTLPPGAAVMKAVKEYHRRMIHFHIAAQATRAGSAELTIRVDWLDGVGVPIEVPLPVLVNPAT